MARVNGHVEPTPAGTYRVRWRDQEGRQRSRNAKTKAEARLVLLEIQTAVQSGTYTDPKAGKETVAHYAEHWLATHHARLVTVNTYREMLQRYVLPILGNRRLADLDYEILLAWVNALKKQPNQETGRPLSASTVHGAHRVLKAMLATAVKTRRIPYNPATGLPLPTAPKPEWTTISQTELDKLLLELPEGTPRTLVLCAATTGLRWSELAGLKWENVLLAERVIKVRTTLTASRGVMIEGQPKSERSRRSVPMSRRLTEALIELRVRQPSGPGDYVFLSKLNRPLINSNFFKYYWSPARDRAGMSGLRLHDLRHSYATWLVEDGNDMITVRDLLGHDSIATTQIYSHSDADRMRRAMSRLFDEEDR